MLDHPQSMTVSRHCIVYQQNEEKRRHCNVNWKPTRENHAKLQICYLIWHHHWRNHYSYDIIRVTRSSTNLYFYYFIIKSKLFIKILQRSKNRKNMKFVQNYKFPKIFRCSQQNSHYRISESCRTLKISQNMSNRYKLKATKTQPTPVYTFWNFTKSLSGRGEWFYRPSSEVEIWLRTKDYNNMRKLFKIINEGIRNIYYTHSHLVKCRKFS